MTKIIELVQKFIDDMETINRRRLSLCLETAEIDHAELATYGAFAADFHALLSKEDAVPKNPDAVQAPRHEME